MQVNSNTMKTIIFIVTEYLTGILATVILYFIYFFIPNSNISFDTQAIMIMLAAPITYAIFKLISGYYLILFVYLKYSRSTLTEPNKKLLVIISLIAMLSIIILILLLALREGQDLLSWKKQINKLTTWFFSPEKPWSLYVYSGFLSVILSSLFFHRFNDLALKLSKKKRKNN